MAVRFVSMGLIAALFTVNIQAQVSDTAFSKEWAVIDSLIVKQDLTRSALDKTKQVYQKAKDRKLSAQVIKALLYRYSLEQRINTEEPALAIKTVKTEIGKASDPAEKAILHVLLARQYQQYFENHRWSIYGRTETPGNVPLDLATWSTNDFNNTITRHYLLALASRSLLQSQNLTRFSAIILKGNQPSLRPTLFDLLAHEALDFFKSDIYSVRAADPFLLNDPKVLEPAEVFMRTSFLPKDSSAQWQAIQVFQQLIAFHSKDADKNALIDIDIERIQWAHQKAVLSNAEQLYEASLRDVIRKYPSVPTTAYAWYALASLQADKAQRYTPFGDTTNRYAYREALQLIRESGRSLGSNHSAQAELANLQNQILRKEIDTQTELINIPGKPVLSSVRYRNTDTLYARIVRIGNINTYRTAENRYDWKRVLSFPVIQSISQSLTGASDHQSHHAHFKIDALPHGSYAVISSTGKGFDETKDRLSLQPLYVSSISYIRDQQDLFVLDRQTGAPLPRVKVTIWRSKWNAALRRQTPDTAGTKFTDEHGHVRLDLADGNWTFSFSMKGDTLELPREDYVYADAPEIPAAGSERKTNRVFFFTDRALYRPGQEVYFKGIGVSRDRDSRQSAILTGMTGEWLYLRDVNFRKIDSLQFKLNEYGSFSGKFLLPAAALTGRFSISTRNFNGSSVSFSVEEYKRPKFDVTLDKPKGAYRLNDPISITGNAVSYAGNRVDGAKVVYTVTRNKRFMEPYFLPRRYPATPSRQIAQGEARTDANGRFSIAFKALADDINDSIGNPVFEYTIRAAVTDINGETRSANTIVTVGYSALKLLLAATPLAEKDSVQKFSVRTLNFSEQPEPASVSIKLYRLQAPQRMIRERLLPRPDQFLISKDDFLRDFPSDEYDNEHEPLSWSRSETVWERIVQTGTQDTVLVSPGTLAAGYYLAEAVTKDKYGVTLKQTQLIQLFDRNQAKQPYPQNRFVYALQTSAQPGETAGFLSGIPADKIFVISNTKRETKNNVYTYAYHNAGLKKLHYAVTEKDRGGVLINEVFVYDNRAYIQAFPVNVPWTNKALTVRYETYRNKTEPGSAEKWTVSIQGSKGEAAAAELLTAMYDASLDQFSEHRWNVPYVWTNNYLHSGFNSLYSFTVASSAWQNGLPDPYLPVNFRQYDKLAANGYELWFDRLEKLAFDGTLPKAVREKYNAELTTLRDNTAMMQMDQVAYKTAMPAAAPPARREGLTETYNKSVAGSVADEALTDAMTENPATDAKSNIPVQVRKNLNETAFFFPQLYADSTGKYSFHFTMPESLTQWKWISLAHTKELAFGTNSTLVTTQKQLMVQPNAPRFLREGDNMEFSSKIVNMSDKELKGQATLELIDAATHTSVDGWFQNVFPSQYFSIAPGQSVAVKFPVQVPFSYNKPLTWRMVAKTADAGDGEENTLPVLTNRMLVTESLPLLLKGDTTQTFRFDKLLNNKSESLTQHGITVEYTSNPVWYAVQALPYLLEYPYECAEQTFNRFYANTLASFIMNRNPRLKQVLELWKKDSSALLSNLQKNEELKQVLLQETPWVLQAENEAQQKKYLAQLLDLTRLSAQSDAFIARLSQIQLPEGSFSWFTGGYADRYITNYILTGIGQLKRLGALTPDLAIRMRPIITRAIVYLDSKTADDYSLLLKNKADLSRQQVSGTQVDYLYMRSFFRDQQQQAKEAAEFYTAQANKYWTGFNSYYKARIGLISYRNQAPAFALNTILPALVENASTDTKQGMYWKNSFAYSWYQSPVEHQSMMIAFVSEINQDKKDRQLTRYIDDMKTWLLLNKQTNNWRTTMATADACYALLLNGSDWTGSGKTVTVRLGNTMVISGNDKTEAATGYIKKKTEGRLVNSEMGNITVTVNSAGGSTQEKGSPSWGSVYWQYFEDLDKITPAASPLSVVKKLFIEKTTDKGKALQAVGDNEELKIGDKVVARLEIRADRDMDYVHLKDMRAASMEPVNTLSGYKWQDGLGHYESTRDASTSFFFSRLGKGTYVFEYPMYISHSGVFSAGIATIQCMYAPEFTGHSEGMKIRVQ
ncbi:alpha-2-macroglobulin family protein [Sediminibacterium soli]|uniref:alpha-2-macroglobulin family protein n=1 Tax=Sediminibacterium soli TaxID=2698829 RepID=UPI00137A0751|nr:alpha-2-macroglobulin family protein [Sediminibacterium soli]NCI47948.1 alpha-2-macroglobulin [Sediminibacterium soli]